MKNLLMFSLAALALVGGISLYAIKFIVDVRERDDALAETFAERVENLRATDQLFSYAMRRTLDERRWALFVGIRNAVAVEMAYRLAEKASSQHFHKLRTRNSVLRVLRKRLAAQKMSLAEYRAISLRWQSLLAMGEPKALRAAWDREVYVTEKGERRVIPLPAPAKDMTPAERGLLNRDAQLLEESLAADLIGPLLADIAGGD